MAKKDNAPRYVILHDGVGLYRQGQTVSAVELGIQGDDENLQRLLDLGAIVPARDAAASGDTMTLAEALRTDGPPTLPVVPPGVATTPEEVAQVVDPNNPATTNPLPDAS
jgi:hypothetical protein